MSAYILQFSDCLENAKLMIIYFIVFKVFTRRTYVKKRCTNFLVLDNYSKA